MLRGSGGRSPFRLLSGPARETKVHCAALSPVSLSRLDARSIAIWTVGCVAHPGPAQMNRRDNLTQHDELVASSRRPYRTIARNLAAQPVIIALNLKERQQ